MKVQALKRTTSKAITSLWQRLGRCPLRSGQFCPIAKVTEILGDKWMMMIVREILIGAHPIQSRAARTR
jgi:DNA-binding HxlR family transcriptional regulator